MQGHSSRASVAGRRRNRSVREAHSLVERIESRVLLATFDVSSLADSGFGSLRQAVADANGLAGADTINFSVSGTIPLLSELGILSAMTIAHIGGGPVDISGGGAVRIFNTTGAPPGTAVTISGLTLRDGRTTTGAAVLVGDESFTIRDCVVSNNVGTSTGGAVTVQAGSGTVTVDRCTFSSNSRTAGGGITCNSGTGMLVTDSTFVGNVTTIGNTGGGIRFAGTVGPFGVTIRNSTISGNTSGFNGGGIGFGNLFVGTARIQNCTITNNTSQNLGGGGGVGINNTAGTTGTVILDSCIVSGNFATGTGSGPDLFGGVNTPIIANFCAIGSSAGAANFTPDATTTTLLGQNFNLGPLTNYGGPTQTHSLQTSSPAIDNGSNPAGLTLDQRGTGFARVVGPGADIGAYELAPPIIISSQFNFLTSQSLVFAFSSNLSFPNGINAAFSVQNLTTSTPATFNAVQNNNVVTLTFTPPILSDGNYLATVIAANVSGPGGPMGANHLFNFFFLNGDANRDALVNLADYNILSGNYGQSPRNFMQGDFNYDSQVNLADYNILSARYGTQLAPAGLAGGFSQRSIGWGTSVSDETEDELVI